jgi:DNA-binding CsgD family transcriptional regulator
MDEDHTRALCDRLREAEILASDLPIDFVHPLVRQAIYQDLSDGERSTLHRRAAEILASTGAASREVAAHLLATAPNGDQWVVERLRDAAEAAIAEGAHDAARSYMERALKEPSEDEARDRYLLGRAMYEPDLPGSLAVFEAAAEGAGDPHLRVAALRQVCLTYVGLGNFAEAARACEKALGALPEGERDLELVLEAQFFMFAGVSHGWTDELSERIRRVASGASGDTPGERIALQAAALDLFVQGEPADQVIALGSRFPPPPWVVAGIRSPAPMAVAKTLAVSGAWDVARGGIRDYVEACREVGWLHGASVGHGALAEVDRLSGRFADGQVEALTALEISSVRSTFSPAQWQARMNLLAIHIARGELDEAERLAESLPMTFGPKEVAINPWPLEMRGYLRLAQDDLEGGVEDLLQIGEAMEESGWRNPAFSPWWQEAAWALVALGRTSEAKELVRVGEERAHRFGAPYVIGTTLRTRAMLESRKRQIGTLRKSVSVLEGSGPPHELARSLLELGAALRRDGQRGDAREPLGAALELAHRCGAGGLEKRAREELAAAGSRPRTPYQTGATALTASELRTAKLAAEGLSNPEIAQRLFVTRRTVETHLTHVYEKLQIQGRDQLKPALADA